MSTLRAKILSHPAVEQISDERQPGDRAFLCEGDGIWVYLKPGWVYARDDVLHAVHEWTWRRALAELKYVRRERPGES